MTTTAPRVVRALSQEAFYANGRGQLAELPLFDGKIVAASTRRPNSPIVVKVTFLGPEFAQPLTFVSTLLTSPHRRMTERREERNWKDGSLNWGFSH